MNIRKLTHVVFLALVAMSLTNTLARAELTHPALTLTATPGLGADYSLGDNGHALLFNLGADGTITPVTYTVGEGFAFYAVNLATVFDVSYVQTHPPSTGSLPGATGNLQIQVGVPLYLGYYVQPASNGFMPINPTSACGYGWGELVRTTNGLTLVDSALQKPAGGIIVGTTIAVPEPSTWALLGIGAAGALAVCRRRGVA